MQGVEVPTPMQKPPEVLQAAEFRGILFDVLPDQWESLPVAGGTKHSARIVRMLNGLADNKFVSLEVAEEIATSLEQWQ